MNLGKLRKQTPPSKKTVLDWASILIPEPGCNKDSRPWRVPPTPADEQSLVKLYQSSVAWAIVISAVPAGMTRELSKPDLHRIGLGNFTRVRTRAWKLLSKYVQHDEEDQLSSQQDLDATERETPTPRALVVLKQCWWPGANLDGKAFEMLPPGHEAACGFSPGGRACIPAQCFQSPACYICESATVDLLDLVGFIFPLACCFDRVHTTCLKRIGLEAHDSGCHRMSDSASPTSSTRPPNVPWSRHMVLE